MSASSPERAASGAEAGEAALFVINLCASTSPLALVHPSDPQLKRHTFFVTRHREEGRERFRLHMGYFATQEEAEVLLVAVRDIYPAAWAGPAPTSGVPRRGRVTAPAAQAPPARPATPAVVAPPPPVAAQAATQAAAPEPAAPAAPSVPDDTSPTLSRMSNVRAVLAQLSDEPADASPVAPPASPPAAEVPTLAPVMPAARKPPALQRTAAPAATVPPVKPLTPAQTVELLEKAPPAPAPAAAPPPVAAKTAAPAPAAVPTPVRATPPIPQVPAATATAPPARAAAPPAPVARQAPMEIPDVPEEDSVRLVTPEDTQTLRDIKLDVERNAPPCFAVQLLWSVSPIDAASHPHLAIFDAYTLYNVEGSRHGRRWYGLRLGFFKDPNSATQVAYYVRSDYPTVAVVPVAEKERDNATGNGEGARKAAPPTPAAAPQKPQQQTEVERRGLEGFELLEDDRPAPVKRDVGDAPPPAAAAARKEPATVKAAPVKPAAAKPAPRVGGKPTGKRVAVRKPEAKSRVTPGAPVPLDSTFEILGASTLTIDESREVINDNAKNRKVEKKPEASGGRLSRLLNRLGGR